MITKSNTIMGRKRKSWGSKGFQSGHKYLAPGSSNIINESEQPDNPWRPRMSSTDYKLAVKKAPGGGLSTPNAEGVCSKIHLLRPKPPATDPEEDGEIYLEGEESGEMRILHLMKCVDMFNKCYEEHSDKYQCKTPKFDINDEVQWGLCWKISIKCNNCSYISQRYKLYNEAASETRGPKYAMPNLGLQVALQETPISNTHARLILACINTPPPSLSWLQSTANKVGDITVSVGKESLREQCRKLKHVNTLRGSSEKASVGVSLDARYSSNGYGARHKMGQSASQSITTCVENHTEEKKIIGVTLANKLCHAGSLMRSKGLNVNCPGHEGCTATMKPMVPLSEYEQGKQIGKDLAEQDISVRFCTTDGDSRSCEGMRSAMAEAGNEPVSVCERQADTTHLAQSLYRHCKNAKFSDNMFAGDKKAMKKIDQEMFSKDLKHRCQKLYKMLFETTGGDMEKIAHKMPAAIQATIECYSGDCGLCKRDSILCNGGKKNWLAKSVYLQPGCLNPTPEDRSVIRNLLEFYLGKKTLPLLKTNTNTNRNEAINRSLSSSLPKNVSFSRNANARTMATVTRLNEGKAKSVLRIMKAAGCKISKGGGVERAFKSFQRKGVYYKKRSQSSRVISRRQTARITQMKEFLKQRGGQSDYKQRQLDPEINLPVALRRSVRLDHSYGDN